MSTDQPTYVPETAHEVSKRDWDAHLLPECIILYRLSFLMVIFPEEVARERGDNAAVHVIGDKCRPRRQYISKESVLFELKHETVQCYESKENGYCSSFKFITSIESCRPPRIARFQPLSTESNESLHLISNWLVRGSLDIRKRLGEVYLASGGKIKVF